MQKRFGKTGYDAQRRSRRRIALLSTKIKLMHAAEKMAEKLQQKIPRQLFEVPIQACIGGKIIARETVKAVLKRCACQMLWR